MKYLLVVLVAVTITLAFSCKKSDDFNPDTAPDTRTGLLALTDTHAISYCVLVIYDQSVDDTIIWQNTTQDSSFGHGAAFGSSGRFYRHVSSAFQPKNAGRFLQFSFQFRQRIPALGDPVACDWIEGLIHKGPLTFSKDSLMMSLTDHFGLGMTTLNMSSPNARVEVLNIERIEKPSGCTVFRTRIKISDIQFGPFGCIVPPYLIKEGLLQMDYKMF